VLVAVWVGQRRWEHLGGLRSTIVPIAFWAVVAGLIGARLYSVATSWKQDIPNNNPLQILEIWNGGLGIWGGVAGGVAGGLIEARRLKLPLAPLFDMAAPAVVLAQAIGRWGNYFNQELFGLPSKLPWAVKITNQTQLASIPAKYNHAPFTFQPTFLYECLWDLVTFGLLLLIERKVRLRRGYLFAAYAALYTFGRFFTEYLRIDPAHRFLGLRLNDWSSIIVFAVAAAILVVKGRPKPGDDLVGQPLSAGVVAAERARAVAVAAAGPDSQPSETPPTGQASPDGAAEGVGGAAEGVGGAAEGVGGAAEGVGGAAEGVGGAAEDVGGAAEADGLGAVATDGPEATLAAAPATSSSDGSPDARTV
jgi:prolipoprotein diacylglyceryl transferase